MAATAIYSMIMVLWKETAFLFGEPWKGVGKGRVVLWLRCLATAASRDSEPAVSDYLR